MTTSELPTRDHMARQSCRQLGGLMHSYVTGDPRADDIAEYLAAGWLIMADYYDEEDRPSSEVTTELIAALQTYAAALSRLAADLDAGEIAVDALRRIDLPPTARRSGK